MLCADSRAQHGVPDLLLQRRRRQRPARSSMEIPSHSTRAAQLIAQARRICRRCSRSLISSAAADRRLRLSRPSPRNCFTRSCSALRDYLHKCGFKSAVLGLSGGIDSAPSPPSSRPQALGAENVLGVTMPTQFSSRGSIDDSLALAETLGIRCLQIPIQRAFEIVPRSSSRNIFAGLPEDTTEENMQPRLRGDDADGALEQVRPSASDDGQQKRTRGRLLHALWRHVRRPRRHQRRAEDDRLSRSPTGSIATAKSSRANTIEKPPSAELKPDQRDQDTLPPYDLLDPILQLYVEEHFAARRSSRAASTKKPCAGSRAALISTNTSAPRPCPA